MTTRLQLGEEERRSLMEYPAPLHVPDLIKMQHRQRNTPANREWVAEHTGIGRRLCYVVPDLVLKSAPKFIGADGNEIPEVSSRWQEMRAGNLWKKILTQTQIHGWAIATEVKAGPQSYNLGRVTKMEVFSTLDVEEITREQGSGDILSYSVNYEVPVGDVPSEPAKFKRVFGSDDVFHVENETTRNHLGISPLKVAWSHLIFIEYGVYLMALFDLFTGAKILAFPVDRDAGDAEKTSIADNLADVPLQKYLAVAENARGQMNMPQYIESNGKSHYAEHFDTHAKMLALDVGAPVRFLFGDPKGALSAASEDGLATIDYLEGVFKPLEDAIIYWCELNGICAPGEVKRVDPTIELRMSDKDKKELEVIDAQKIPNLLEISTVNEMRERFNLQALPGMDLIPDKTMIPQGGM